MHILVSDKNNHTNADLHVQNGKIAFVSSKQKLEFDPHNPDIAAFALIFNEHQALIEMWQKNGKLSYSNELVNDMMRLGKSSLFSYRSKAF